MSKEKILYKFSVELNKEVLESVTSTNEAGEEVTVKKKVTKPVATEFALIKPSRKLIELCDRQYSIKIGECIKEGILTEQMLTNEYSRMGGIFPLEVQQKYADCIKKIGNIQSDITALAMDKSIEKDESERMSKDLLDELQRELVFKLNYEYQHNRYLEHTAESHAREEKLKYLLVHMLKIKSGANWADYFVGNSFKEKRENLFDKQDAEDKDELELFDAVFLRVAPLVFYFEKGQISTEEDFAAMDNKKSAK